MTERQEAFGSARWSLHVLWAASTIFLGCTCLGRWLSRRGYLREHKLVVGVHYCRHDADSGHYERMHWGRILCSWVLILLLRADCVLYPEMSNIRLENMDCIFSRGAELCQSVEADGEGNEG